MATIVPAILETTKEGFLDKVARVDKLPGVERIHVDFGDGQFITSKLLSAADMDTLNPAFQWEAHLMCKEPKDFLDYQICGFNTIILHYEGFASSEKLMAALAELKQMGFKTGVALNPSTSVDVLSGIATDQFLIMSVIPGKQGQTFIPETLQKIKDLRSLMPHAIIDVDGGVNETNIKSLADSGADLICAGSSLVKAEDVNVAWEGLQKAMS